MTRLTNDMRDNIISQAIDKKFNPLLAKHKEAEHKLAMELYRHVFPKKIRDDAAAMPKEWIRQDGCLMFNCTGYSLRFTVKEKVPVPYSANCHMLGAVTGDLAIKAQKHAEYLKDLNSQKNQMWNKLRGMIYSFNTLKQIKETWPEGSEFYKIYETKPDTVQLPAIQIKEINDMLGLKTK